MRDARVQEFLRELIVGVVLPSDLAGSIMVEIFHCGEDGDVEQAARTLKQISRVCDCSSLSQLTCVYILVALNCLHLFICLIFTCA